MNDFRSAIIDKVVAMTSDIVNGIGSFFTNLTSNLGGWFGSLFDNITSLPSLIVDGFKSLLKLLFVPEDGFLNEKISKLKNQLAGKFHMETYEEFAKALKAYKEGSVSFGGYINTSMWDKHLPTVKNYIRAFFYPLLLFGIYKYIIWLIRGSSQVGTAAG